MSDRVRRVVNSKELFLTRKIYLILNPLITLNTFTYENTTIYTVPLWNLRERANL